MSTEVLRKCRPQPEANSAWQWLTRESESGSGGDESWGHTCRALPTTSMNLSSAISLNIGTRANRSFAALSEAVSVDKW
eukprot:COSAG05_NODE_529_length_8913_cov_14.963921_8_plen_79_part_00